MLESISVLADYFLCQNWEHRVYHCIINIGNIGYSRLILCDIYCVGYLTHTHTEREIYISRNNLVSITYEVCYLLFPLMIVKSHTYVYFNLTNVFSVLTNL